MVGGLSLCAESVNVPGRQHMALRSIEDQKALFELHPGALQALLAGRRVFLTHGLGIYSSPWPVDRDSWACRRLSAQGLSLHGDAPEVKEMTGNAPSVAPVVCAGERPGQRVSV